MIRKQIILKSDRNSKLDYNYQHSLLGAIYRLLDTSDKRLSKKLHNEGFKYKDGRIFKLFNQTLLFENAIFLPDGIVVTEDTTVKLIISGKKEIIENIIVGIVKEQHINIANTKLNFLRIEEDKKVNFKDVLLLETLSPISISRSGDGGIDYLTPFEDGYFKIMAENLMKKYYLIYDEKFTDDLFFDIDDFLQIKNKSIKIKKGYIRCCEYRIWMETTEKMQKIAYYLGLGDRNSLGLGCMNYLMGDDLIE